MSAGDVIAIYAAFVATVSAGWQIYKESRENAGRIFLHLRTLSKERFDASLAGKDLDVLITNRGKSPRTIRLPLISYRFIDTTDYFGNHARLTIAYESYFDAEMFPKTLEPGEEYKHSVPSGHLKEAKSKGVKTIRIVVSDTHGKKYYSDKISII